MTDGNTYAINKYLNEREDFDALQEVTAELEQAEARIEELELAVRYEADLAQMALDARKELEGKLVKAVEALGEAVYLLDPDEKDMARKAGVYRVVTTLAELKGQEDD